MLLRGHVLSTAVALGLAVLYTISLAVLNPPLRGPLNLLFLLFYLTVYHAALGLLARIGLATTALIPFLARTIDPTSRRLVWYPVTGLLATLFVINAVFWYPISYAPLRFGPGAPPALTPLGLWNLLVFSAAVPLSLWCLQRWPAKSSRISKPILRTAIGWLVCLGVTLAVNAADNRYIALDLEALRVPPSDTSYNLGQEDRQPANVLLLGFDGITWDVVGPLIEQGDLPNLAHLVSRGTVANLETLLPTQSAPIWTTVATGHQPTSHGITGFVVFDLPGMTASIARGPMLAGGSKNWWNGFNRALVQAARLGLVTERPFDAADRQRPAIWEIAGQYGVSSGLVNWWCVWPPAPPAEGSYVVSDLLGRPGSMLPETILAELAQAPPLTPSGDAAILARRPDLRHELEQGTREIELGRQLYESHRPRLAINYTHFVDKVQHRAWRGDDPGLWLLGSGLRLADEDSYVAAAYRQMDAWLGSYLRALSDDTLILVVSDHGYSFDGREHLHAPPGVLIAAGAGVRRGQVLRDATVLDLAPTILAALDLPRARTMSGTVLGGIFSDQVTLLEEEMDHYAWFEPIERTAGSSEAEQELLDELRALGYVN